MRNVLGLVCRAGKGHLDVERVWGRYLRCARSRVGKGQQRGKAECCGQTNPRASYGKVAHRRAQYTAGARASQVARLWMPDPTRLEAASVGSVSYRQSWNRSLGSNRE